MAHIQLSGSKYINTYYRLISKYSQHKEQEVTECHHITPKFAGGNSAKDNLVHVPIRVHFILHVLLWKHFKHQGNSTLAHKAGLSINSFLMDSSGFRILTRIPKSRFIQSIRCCLVENGKRSARKLIGSKRTDETKHKLKKSHWTKSGVIKHPMLGKRHTEDSKKKMGLNSTRHYWKAISPNGSIFLFRSAQKFAKENELSVDTMKIYGLTKSGQIVSECSRISQATPHRLNTTGWTFYTSPAPL